MARGASAGAPGSTTRLRGITLTTARHHVRPAEHTGAGRAAQIRRAGTGQCILWLTLDILQEWPSPNRNAVTQHSVGQHRIYKGTYSVLEALCVRPRSLRAATRMPQ